MKDLAKWEAALCGEMILNKSTKEQMWSPYESRRGKEREYGFTQGLGWHISNYSRRVVSHNGSIKGFAANMTRFIDDKLCVILLGNLENINRPDALAQLNEVIAKTIAEYFSPALAQESLQPPLV